MLRVHPCERVKSEQQHQGYGRSHKTQTHRLTGWLYLLFLPRPTPCPETRSATVECPIRCSGLPSIAGIKNAVIVDMGRVDGMKHVVASQGTASMVGRGGAPGVYDDEITPGPRAGFACF